MKVATKEIEIRYVETDQMGIVYHANYVIWMEVGRTALTNELGFHYSDMEKEGILVPVTGIQVHYKKPMYYGEIATIRTWIDTYDGIRITYGYEIFNPAGEVAVTATSQHVCVKKETFQPVVIRKYFPEWHESYERAKKRGSK